MLAVVKAPLIDLELSCHGTGLEEFLKLIEAHCNVKVVYSGAEKLEIDENEETVALEDSEFWQANKQLALTGARLKKRMTQKKLSEISGIGRTLLCEYESGKRSISRKTAEKLAAALDTFPEKFLR